MIPFKINPTILWYSISFTELETIAHYQRYKGNVKFHASGSHHRPEHEIIFCRALAKFQHLVIFEE